jgi:hypothetical protein
VDLVGPSTVQMPTQNHLLSAFICILDPGTGWFEVVELPNKQLYTIIM